MKILSKKNYLYNYFLYQFFKNENIDVSKILMKFHFCPFNIYDIF